MHLTAMKLTAKKRDTAPFSKHTAANSNGWQPSAHTPSKEKGYGTLQQPIAMDGSLQHTHSRVVCGTPARRKVTVGGGRSRQA